MVSFNIKQIVSGGVDYISSVGVYPIVEKLKITNNIKNKIILIFFIAPKFIFFFTIFFF